MEHIFRVLQRDSKGKPVRDDNDELIYDEYVYNFELMSMDRMLAGRKLFYLSNKEFDMSPKDNDELTSLVSREAERQAFAAILMKKTKENEFERYDPYKVSSFDALNDIKGEDSFKKLMECQDHFFLKVGLQSPELMKQSLDIMKQSINILKTYAALEKSTGIEMKELIHLTGQSIKSSKEKTKESNSIQETQS
ncbi:hypothetical protein MASR1M45_12750 [Candidatus Kapaibacterium sp.]